MIRGIVIFLLLIPTLICRADSTLPKPRNVIFIIADGFGPAAVTLGRYFKNDALHLDKWLHGSVRTYSENSAVTDSAAGATAYATGVKAYNRAISIDKTGKKLSTLMEAAKNNGMMTGVVVTSSVTDATPASFMAHVKDRSEQASIAEQEIKFHPDLLLGGGRDYFIPEKLGGIRKDNQDFIAKAKHTGYCYVTDKKTLLSSNQLPLLGLFAKEVMSFEIDRDKAKQPSLAEMTDKALTLLASSDKSFFLLLEASRIDHAAHNNDVATAAREIVAYDETIATVQTFIKSHPDTLVIATADHETGGLTLGRDVDHHVDYRWNRKPLLDVKASREVIQEKLNHHESLNTIFQLLGLKSLSHKEKLNFQKLYNQKKYTQLVDNLYLKLDKDSRTGWTTRGHTAVDVNLYAAGVGNQSFYGNQNNIDVARVLAEMLQLKIGKA